MSGRNASQYRELLRAGRWFGSLPAELQDGLLCAGMVRGLAAGERLFSRGDPPSGLYALVDGAVRITALTESGKEVLLTMAEPPVWIGEIAVFDRLPRTHDAVADGAAVVIHVPLEAIDALLARVPAWWRELGQLVAGKLRLAFVALEDRASAPIAVRLARRLVLMALGEWQDRQRRVIDVRQEQLALMLSTSRQTVNQLLQGLEAAGLVRLAYGQVEILDLEGLRHAAK